MEYEINVSRPPEHMVELADRLLRTPLDCEPSIRTSIRALAKALIDESDEIKRTIADHDRGVRTNLDLRSPEDMWRRAITLGRIQLSDPTLQMNVRGIAIHYLVIADANRTEYEKFLNHYGVKPTDVDW